MHYLNPKINNIRYNLFMKKKLLFIGLILTLFGCGTSPTVDEKQKVLHANLNTYVNNQKPLKGLITYTQVPAFHWRDIYHNIKSSSADEVLYKVFGKIEIPDVITTDKVYVTFGEDIFFSNNATFPLSDAQKIMGSPRTKHTLFQFYGFVNDKKLTMDTISTDVKTDVNAKRYVDFSLLLHIKFLGDEKSKAYARQRAYSFLNQYFFKKLDRVLIQIAPNTRDYKTKLGIPAVYAE